jgi:light-regulated signal transduction histidine kinase (bacteriophytochrome)
MRVVDRIHPSSHAGVAERIGILQQGGTVPVSPETWVRLDGSVVELSVAAVSIVYAGRPVFQMLIRDETARLRAEADLVEAKNTLEQRVHERTADLERLNAELQSFTYSVSHDLRAPIRHIDGFARMLEEREAAALSPEGKRYLATIRNSANRMGALIDDLLRLSRLGRDTLRAADVDMESAVRTVWDELTARPGPAVELHLDPLPAAHADPSLVRQVWQNLLDNAIKYSSKSPSPRVTVDAVRENGHVWYRVADNGVGFDPRYAGKMFSVFQRLHRPDEFPGTGVGLAIVKKVVDLHGGQVRARGEPGRGAIFEFTV